MALDIYMIGVIPANMEKSLEFYQRLGLAVPDDSAGKPHVGIKMKGDLTFFLNNTGLVEAADKPRIMLEFYLKERAAVDAKYAEMVGYGYSSYRAPFLSSFNIYFAMVNDPDGNIILLSADG